ncbi:hypothetical protein BH09MYX1_BH09MYX1_43420 [soil metagenome]
MVAAAAHGVLAGCAAGGTFAALGAGILVVGLRIILRERRTRSWPKAPGTILASSVATETGTVRDRNNEDVDSTSYQPSVVYRYVVDGKSFDGTRVKLSPSSMSDPKRAKEFLDRYPFGAKVDVAYDPADPKSAYLESGTSGGAIFLTIFGGFFCAIGVLVLALILAFG